MKLYRQDWLSDKIGMKKGSEEGCMVVLRDRMEECYAEWQADLPEELLGPDGQPVPGWRTFFAECVPLVFDCIPEHLQIAADAQVWPGRRHNRPYGAPVGSHVCLPFDGILPTSVHVVVLGEDPYPSISGATGRAFEDGTPDAAGEAIKLALRVLGQSALDLHGDTYPPGFCHGREGRDVAIKGCFDQITAQGVLCLNASWTYTEQAHKSAHRGLWKPVTAYLLERLAERPEGPPVLLLLGIKAERFFDSLHLQNLPQAVVVRSNHPSERENRYFAGPNPFQLVNESLQALHRRPVTWWSLPVENEPT